MSGRHPGSSPTSSARPTSSITSARRRSSAATGEHSVRPEKLTLAQTAPEGDGIRSAPGTVVESIYVGSGIRSVVDLDAGARVTVLEPNVRGRVDDEERGNRVVVSWHDSDVISLYPPAGGG